MSSTARTSSISARGPFLWMLGAGQVLLLAPLVALERRMKRTGGPGIIPFELAGTPERSRRIMERWGPEGRAAARTSLLLDYPFLVTYSGFQLAACRAASDALRRRGANALADAGRVIGCRRWRGRPRAPSSRFSGSAGCMWPWAWPAGVLRR